MDLRTVYVGNLTVAADEKALRSIFEVCGQVTQIRMAGKPDHAKIFAFVEFAHPESTDKALAMDGLQVGEYPIRVKLAKSNPAPTVTGAPAPRRGPLTAAYAAPRDTRGDYGARDYPPHRGDGRREAYPPPGPARGDAYARQPPAGHPPPQPAYADLPPPAHAPKYGQQPPPRQPHGGEPARQEQWGRGAAPPLAGRRPDEVRYPPPAQPRAYADDRGSGYADDRGGGYTDDRGGGGSGYARGPGGGGYAAQPEWAPPEDRGRSMPRHELPPQPRYDVPPRGYEPPLPAPRSAPPPVGRYDQQLPPPRAGPPPRLDARGRPPSDREAWRDRDRGYGSWPYPPVASRSAAIASYAGRPGPGGGRRPDDPERVRRTVFVDNVENTYDEESIAVFFSRLGTVTKVRLGPDSHGVRRAWAEFETAEQAKLALQYNSQMLGSKKVRVEPSKSAIHNSGLPPPEDRRAPAQKDRPRESNRRRAEPGSRSRSRSPVLRRSRSLELEQVSGERGSTGTGQPMRSPSREKEQQRSSGKGNWTPEATTDHDGASAVMQVDADESTAQNGVDSSGQHGDPVADSISPVMHDPGQESVATALGSDAPAVMNGE